MNLLWQNLPQCLIHHGGRRIPVDNLQGRTDARPDNNQVQGLTRHKCLTDLCLNPHTGNSDLSPPGRFNTDDPGQ